jgi:luciferase family oxidoreductase group 1
MIQLGVLDLCQIGPGNNARSTLIDTLKLASITDALGYSRYWLGENHHSSFAQSSPDVMALAVLGRTKRIHVGTGALLLTYQNPLRVANNFRLLELLFPGRIDLGIGRGIVITEYAEAFLKQEKDRVRDIDYYEGKVKELLSYLRGKNKVPAIPKNVNIPEFWMLGRNRTSMWMATRHGSRFSLSLFLGDSVDEAAIILEEYRTTFQPSKELVEPKFNLAVAGVCAETEKEVERLIALHNKQGDDITPTIFGTPKQCLTKFREFQSKCGVDEFIFLDICSNLEDKKRSYELLAEVCELRNNID